MTTHYYLDKKGRPRWSKSGKSAKQETIADLLERGEATRTLHPDEARLLGVDPLTPYSAEKGASADLVAVGEESAPLPSDPAPSDPELSGLAKAETSTNPAPDPESDPADLEGDLEGDPSTPETDEGPLFTERNDPEEPSSSTDPPTDAQPRADAEHCVIDFDADFEEEEPDTAPEPEACRDPDCPYCATETRTCGRGHTYTPVSEAAARQSLFTLDMLACKLKHSKTGRPQIPLAAMTTPESCAALGLPPEAVDAVDAQVEATRQVMQKHASFMAKWAPEMSLIVSTIYLGTMRSAAVAAREADNEAKSPST